jgi:hypothetical protein
MGVALGESDLTASISESDYPCDDRAAHCGVILDDHGTSLRRGVELDDFEQSREAGANIEKDAEYISCNHRARNAAPRMQPSFDEFPIRRPLRFQVVAKCSTKIIVNVNRHFVFVLPVSRDLRFSVLEKKTGPETFSSELRLLTRLHAVGLTPQSLAMIIDLPSENINVSLSPGGDHAGTSRSGPTLLTRFSCHASRSY